MRVNPSKNRRIFYGWAIVAAGFICLWINVGIGFYSFPVFLVDLTENLGWGRGPTTVGISLTFIFGGFASPLVGRLIPKYGPKKLILAGALLMSAAFILFGFMRNIWQFYAICGLLAFGLSCAGPMSTSYAVSDWFSKKRGRAVGIMMVGVGVGGLTFVPLTNKLLSTFQWQKTFIIYGFFISIVMLPVAAAVFKRRPAELGVLPDGEDPEDEPGPHRPQPARTAEVKPAWTFKEAMRTHAFWAIAAAFILATFGQTPILVHQVAYFEDIGISPEKAAGALALCAFLGIGGKLFFGAIADRYPTRYAMMLCFGLQLIGTLLLIQTKALGSPFWFVIVWGFAMGGVIALEPLIVAECFGLESFGVILGMLYVFTTIGGSVGAPFAGFVFDVNKSYLWAFMIFVATYLFATLLSMLAVPPGEPQERLAKACC